LPPLKRARCSCSASPGNAPRRAQPQQPRRAAL